MAHLQDYGEQLIVSMHGLHVAMAPMSTNLVMPLPNGMSFLTTLPARSQSDVDCCLYNSVADVPWSGGMLSLPQGPAGTNLCARAMLPCLLSLQVLNRRLRQRLARSLLDEARGPLKVLGSFGQMLAPRLKAEEGREPGISIWLRALCCRGSVG